MRGDATFGDGLPIGYSARATRRPAFAAAGSGAAISLGFQTMTAQTVRVGTQEVVIAPAEAEDGSFVASVRGGRHAPQSFDVADWSDPRVRLDAARTICEAFAITRNNQNLTKIARTIDEAMA